MVSSVFKHYWAIGTGNGDYSRIRCHQLVKASVIYLIVSFLLSLIRNKELSSTSTTAKSVFTVLRRFNNRNPASLQNLTRLSRDTLSTGKITRIVKRDTFPPRFDWKM